MFKPKTKFEKEEIKKIKYFANNLIILTLYINGLTIFMSK